MNGRNVLSSTTVLYYYTHIILVGYVININIWKLCCLIFFDPNSKTVQIIEGA